LSRLLCPSVLTHNHLSLSLLPPRWYFDTFTHTHTSFERNYDPVHVRDLMVDNPWIPLLAVTLYGIAIVCGRAYFKDRPAWNLRTSMALWNLFLSVFSMMGFLRMFPQLVHNLTGYTLVENLCHDPESHFGSGASGLWVQIFCLSKFPYVFDAMRAVSLCSPSQCGSIPFGNPASAPILLLFFIIGSIPVMVSYSDIGNYSTPSTLWFTRSHFSSCIGTIIFLYCCIAGMRTSPRRHLAWCFV
jgi:hypothetical protein